MEKKKVAEKINHLIEINNDRVEGYDRAVDEVEDPKLKATFLDLSLQSKGFRTELEGLVKGLGETPTTGTSVSGKVYRAWMDIKAALTGKDKKKILNSCEFGEDVAKDSYKDVLNDKQMLPNNVKDVVEKQFSEIKQSHDKIKSMRDSADIR